MFKQRLFNSNLYIYFFICFLLILYLNTIFSLFQIQTGDEKWFRERNFYTALNDWYIDYGYYRFIGIFLVKFLIDFIPEDSRRFLVLTSSFLICYLFLIFSALKFLEINIKLIPWILIFPFYTPFWLPSLLEPVRLIQDCSVYVLSGFFLLFYNKISSNKYRIFFITIFFTLSILIYESCVAFIIALIVAKNRFNIIIVFKSILVVFLVLLIYKPKWLNPKITRSLNSESIDAYLISINDILNYINIKIKYLFSINDNFYILLFIFIFVILYYIYINININKQENNNDKTYIYLMIIAILTPLFFLVIMNLRNTNIAIPWTIYFISINAFSISFVSLFYYRKIIFLLYLIICTILFISFYSNLEKSMNFYKICETKLIEKTLYNNFFKEFGFKCE